MFLIESDVFRFVITELEVIMLKVIGLAIISSHQKRITITISLKILLSNAMFKLTVLFSLINVFSSYIKIVNFVSFTHVRL